LGDGGGVMFPRGTWSYAPMNETERSPERPFLRPLAIFQGHSVYACSQDRRTVFRRDFKLEAGEKFDSEWFAGWPTYNRAAKGGDLWRPQRMAHGAAWSVTPLAGATGRKETISASLVAGEAIYVVGSQGHLAVLDTKTGVTLSQFEVGTPAWDGLAAAEGKLLLSTQDGRVMCLGAK
jgi:hypothetical protein